MLKSRTKNPNKSQLGSTFLKADSVLDQKVDLLQHPAVPKPVSPSDVCPSASESQKHAGRRKGGGAVVKLLVFSKLLAFQRALRILRSPGNVSAQLMRG